MIKLEKSDSSFRDPSGHILYDENLNVYRVITQHGEENFKLAESSGLYDSLIQSGKLIAYEHEEMEQFEVSDADPISTLVSHPKIPFISYPYEWSFEQLRQAALLQLDIYIESLGYGMTLSDATAYNIQFIGARPVFIDLLSFQRYEEGMLWKGQQQFVDQFLSPLLLWSYAGVPYNEFYRGHFTGVPAQIVHAAVPWYRKLSIRYLNYIYMPMLFERKQRGAAGGRKKTVQGKLPKVGFEFILKQLRKWVVSLQAPEQETTWSHYDAIRNYNEQEIEQKHRFLEAVIREEKPKTLWDIGCNTGEFSLVSLEAGADYVVGIEMDHGALAQAFEQSQTVGDKFLPLYQNLLNPSANMGWAQKERMGIQERGDVDMIVALAVLHHLVIGGNVPLKSAVEYLTERAASGVIEWVPKEDGMVQALLANREDVFPHYDEEMFRQLLEERVTIISEERISASGRKLFYYKRQA